MFKKLISISLVAMMLSVTVFATPYLETLDTSLVANANSVFKYAESKITSVTEDGTEHLADLSATKWDGETATDIADLETTTIGDATYYKITSGADLAGFAEYVNTAAATTDAPMLANAILVNDIDLGGENWKDYQIGKSYNYGGHFEGNGHTIYNFYILGDDVNKVGGLFKLFGKAESGKISNLNFVDAKHVSKYTGGNTQETRNVILVGYMSGAGALIENVSVSGEITVQGTGTCDVGSAGALVGTITNGTIRNCYSDITIDLSNAKVGSTSFTSGVGNNGIGGLIGVMNPGSSASLLVENCGFGGEIIAPYNIKVGGIAGAMKATYDTWEIKNCYNTGKITGKVQVAGIVGWVGSSGTYQKTDDIVGAYNAGDIVAKSATDSHASGIANGAYAKSMENVYSTGDVYVEVDGVKSFNDKCALLYTHLGTGSTSGTHYNAGTSAYCSDYNKPSSATANTTTPTRYSETGYTKAEFANGTALTTLGDNYAKLAGLNNGYPVFTWQTSAPLTNANTYYVANGSLALALENPGYVSLYIAPLGGSATVNGKTITEAGTYTFTAEANATTVSVTGQALITIDLMNQRAGSALTALEATAIKAEIADTESRTIVLALFNGDALEKVVYTANATFANGAVSAVIDLSSETVTDKTLKAFVWENGTLAPIAEDPYTLSQQ